MRETECQQVQTLNDVARMMQPIVLDGVANAGEIANSSVKRQQFLCMIASVLMKSVEEMDDVALLLLLVVQQWSALLVRLMAVLDEEVPDWERKAILLQIVVWIPMHWPL